MLQLLHLFAACPAGQVCFDALPHARAADGSFTQAIISIVIGLAAALSVLFVVIGGMRYIFSQGDPGAAAKARGTIVYALIGLAVAIAAEVIVVFVIKRVQ